jgi:exodeoxyribonuclease VII large subunit
MSAEKQVFTLKQVAASIQKTVSERYNRLYWVQAEMHKLNFTNKGHCYPELVQKEEGKIVTEMRGTIWKAQFDKISRSFVEVVKEPLRDGLSLLFQVRISFHPLYGMGLEIVDIDPTYALGELHKEREATLQRLAKEGFLNVNQSLDFPLLPQRIALISVDSSKGLSDFYSVVLKNNWNYKFFFMLFPAQLNGDLAINSIQQQLKRIAKVKHHFDAVAIVRGGGGEIGMSCYNNYELAKAIATFPLPVLTGIGHSTNITVTEMVAFRNAITPTELADFLLQAFHEFAVPVQEASRRIGSETRKILQRAHVAWTNEWRVFRNVTLQQLSGTKQGLKVFTRNLLTQTRFRFSQQNDVLKRANANLQKGVRTQKNRELQQLGQARQLLQKNTLQQLGFQHSQVEDVKQYVYQQIPRFLQQKTQELAQAEKHIRLMDPMQVLKRGYSMSLFEGKTISSENPVKAGDIIETLTFEQRIKSEVRETSQQEHE